MKSLFKIFTAGFILLNLWLLMPDAVAQCAMCRATVESNTKNQKKGAPTGLNTGILYLMTIPYILIGTVGFMWYRSYKKKNA